ncbi:receptor-binding cancer antigen expressed on SiSo cells [Onthophagus taurus]|uniref:receptor-binding cancer antigen expressed on SiSo cells n=1 Tax=Onthophagus taurus TaxID=166361 RepID=UPI0039BE3D63
MVISILIHKLRSFMLFLIGIFRRALCCFHKRRRVSFDEPLTGIGVVKSENEEMAWNDWGDDRLKNPTTVQEHIEFYRQQKAQLQKQEEEVENQEDFFENMTPEITRQKKIFVANENKEGLNEKMNVFVPSGVSMGKELGEWDENPGWEGEELDWDAMQVLKEKKRLDREKKFAEQQQRRIERTKTLGIKIKT